MNKKNIKAALDAEKIIDAPEQRYFKQHYWRYLETLSKIPETYIIGKTVMDLGAIPGHLSVAVKNLGAKKVLGFDYDPERYDYKNQLAHKGVSVVQADFEKDALAAENNSADLILFTEVIEHFQNDPTHILSEIRRVLKIDGLLILTTPNINNLSNRFRKIFGKKIYPTAAQMGDRKNQLHYHEYAMAELCVTLYDAGFEIANTAFIPGTEQSLLHGTFPTKIPFPLTQLYGLIALTIPPLRSYLFVSAKKIS